MAGEIEKATAGQRRGGEEGGQERTVERERSGEKAGGRQDARRSTVTGSRRFSEFFLLFLENYGDGD